MLLPVFMFIYANFHIKAVVNIASVLTVIFLLFFREYEYFVSYIYDYLPQEV